MILLLDTSSRICKLTLIDGDWRYDDEWQSDRDLANGLLQYLNRKLSENKKTWLNISAICVFRGPGSFTGLRIGLTVLNTIADSMNITIVGEQGEDWQEKALQKIQSGKDEKIVLPFYGAEANITIPRK